jgi:peptidoglycan/xylan/chitin deacetylase (PgdA/CDA1 family)
MAHHYTLTALAGILILACNAENQQDVGESNVAQSPLVTSGVTSNLSLSSDWGTGYCANVTLTNASSTPVTSWSLTINLHQSVISQSWSGNFTSTNGSVTVKSLANTTIAAKSSTSFGFCANSTSSSYRPSETALTVVGGGTGGSGGSSSTGGSPATGGTPSVGGTTSYACGLPVAGTSSVAKPSGTPGNLKVINWAGLKGAVSYTFDDGNSSQISNYATLKSLGVPFTFYLVTGWANASNAVWAQAVADGHELGNHTKTHASTATAADIDAATAFLQQKFGVKAWTMAAPNGSTSYMSFAQARFLLNRGVSNALIAPNDATNAFNLPAYIPPSGASTSTLNSQVASAQSAGAWRVMLVHGFLGGSDAAYQPIGLNEFVSHVNYTKNLGNVWIDTMTKIGAYWRGQKVVSSVTPTTSGNTKTYSWSLPANFPPGKCLRVTVDGGTVKQSGKTLSWNSRGYYEISLDAGSVTISP